MIIQAISKPIINIYANKLLIDDKWGDSQSGQAFFDKIL